MSEEYKPIEGFKIIAESINDSVPSTKELFDKGDIEGIINLAKSQADAGAAYIDINIGKREPLFMSDLITKIQTVVDVPISIDSPDFEILKAGLIAYDSKKAGIPIINSVSELRPEILELNNIKPIMPILICTERLENGSGQPNKTAQEVYDTAKRLHKVATSAPYSIPNEQIIFDPGLAPIGADYEGLTKCTLDAIKMIHEDVDLKGVHMSVGLSNFSQMLPIKRANGGLVKTPLDSAFLTLTIPMGLDMSIASTKKKYRLLADTDDALITIKEAVEIGGMESIMRVQEFYS